MLIIMLSAAVIFLAAGRYLDREDFLKEKAERVRLQVSNEIYESELQKKSCELESVHIKLKSKIMQDDSIKGLTESKKLDIEFHESKQKPFKSSDFISRDDSELQKSLSGIRIDTRTND